MDDFAEIYLNWFVAGLLVSALVIGCLIGAGLRAFTALSRRKIWLLAGITPILLLVLVLAIDMRRHSAPSITDYAGWNSLFQLALLFGFLWLGARAGTRLVEKTKKYASDVATRAKDGVNWDGH